MRQLNRYDIYRERQGATDHARYEACGDCVSKVDDLVEVLEHIDKTVLVDRAITWGECPQCDQDD